jgi:hypothetical protein
MDITRYHVFLAGVVVVLLGVELRMVDSFVLTQKATKFLAEQTGHPVIVASNTLESLAGAEPQLPPKALRPPEWVSWLLLSVGAVLVLQSGGMPKPG